MRPSPTASRRWAGRRARTFLQPGELLAACAGLRVVAYEDGFLDAPARYVQRIVAARRPPAHARFALESPIGRAG